MIQGLILAADRPPAFPKPVLVLLPILQRGKLLVGCLEKLGKLQAPPSEPAGKIGSLPLPLFQHNWKGVVQGIIGGNIVVLPAGIPQGAFPADLVGAPVKNGGGVAVVDTVFREGGAESVPHRAKRFGGGTQPLPHIFRPAALRIARFPLLHGRAQTPQTVLRQKKKDHRSDEGLVEHTGPGAGIPQPQSHRGVGDHIAQGGEDPPLPPACPGEKS